MTLQRPFSRSPGGPSPGGASRDGAADARTMRARMMPVLSLILGITLCALAASALFVPGFVFGAEAGAETASEASAETSAETATEAGAETSAETGAGVTGSAPAETPSLGSLLITLPWGSGDGEVGLERPVDGLTRGPEALAVAPNGRIAVLDSVNNRLVFLDATGSWAGAFAVPLAEPRFLAVDDDRLYVLDCDADRQLLTLGWDGAILDALALPEVSDVVTGLFATPEGPCFEVAHESVFLMGGTSRTAAAGGRAASVKASLRPVAGRPVGPDLGRAAKATFAPGVGLRIQSFQLDRSSLKAKKTAESRPVLAPGRTVEHLVSVDGDGTGGLIVGARLLETPSSDDERLAGGEHASLLLTRLGSIGNGRGANDTLLLGESSFAYLGQPYVIALDGRVLQPVADESGYSILVHAFAGDETPRRAGEVAP